MKLLTITVSIFISCLVHAQSAGSCESLHSGIFYYYGSAGAEAYIREGSIQKEVNPKSGDTAVWRVGWKSDCHYTLTYLYGQGPFSEVAKAVKSKIAVDVEIVRVTADYYVYKTAENIKTHSVETSDTLWLKEQPLKPGQQNLADASFPGGIEAWGEYLSEELNKHRVVLGKSRKEGVCVVQFVIEADGSLSNVRALNKQGSRIAHYAVEAISNSPKWIPAIVEGQPKRTVKLQPVSLVLVEEKKD